ncbi:hypothetical protein OG384_04675 [Streptomyces sp. NBC_01324]|uniref:hypothetical protein n=1 Tax=Streptomyces sp. NBC_01324 TaxID=2903826 RepID=UPI002E1438BD|nr:hypothetical protein OG384_04675 [Streptomyces sp. NBC_01324]
MTANPIERLDVPLTAVEAAADRIIAWKREAAEQLMAGLSAEYRHLLYDADPDATVPAFVDLHHHQSTRRGTQ